MNVVKVLVVALLGIVSVLVLLAVILPAVSLVLGLGVDIPNSLARSGKVLFLYAHPWLPLLVGALFLALLGWGAWRYDLGTLNWRPDLKLDKDEAVFITPPERIELLAERGTQGREKNGYLVRPAPGVPQSVHRSAYWMPIGPKKIEIVFTTGTSGLEMQLTVQGETLQGKAKTFWDFLRRHQTAHIIAHKINCAN